MTQTIHKEGGRKKGRKEKIIIIKIKENDRQEASEITESYLYMFNLVCLFFFVVFFN